MGATARHRVQTLGTDPGAFDGRLLDRSVDHERYGEAVLEVGAALDSPRAIARAHGRRRW